MASIKEFGDILSPRILTEFSLLAVISAVPVIIKRREQNKAAAAAAAAAAAIAAAAAAVLPQPGGSGGGGGVASGGGSSSIGVGVGVVVHEPVIRDEDRSVYRDDVVDSDEDRHLLHPHHGEDDTDVDDLTDVS